MGTAAQPCLDRYEVVDELGHGAMGTVYLAQDPLIGRLVALKTFHSSEVLSAEQLAELRTLSLHEARTAGILSHPNIVAIHDIVQTNEGRLPLIAMEYVQGTNLLELLKGRAPLPTDFVRRVARQIGSALDYAHSMGVVHGDVKPANILITEDEQAKLTDFGIASLDGADLTRGKRLLGTPSYVAPERILGRRMDHRADIFSLGVVLFEMLFGRTAFPGTSAAEIVHSIAHEPFEMPAELPPELADLGPGLGCLLARALHKSPEERYQRASELAEDLELVCSPALERGDPAATQDLLELFETPEAEEQGTRVLSTGALEPPARVATASAAEEPAAATEEAAPATKEPATPAPQGAPPADHASKASAAGPAAPPAAAGSPLRATRPQARRLPPTEPPAQKTSPRRLAIAMLVVCLAVLPLVGWLALQRLGTTAADDDGARRREQIFGLLQRGRGQLTSGHPEAAATTLRLVEDLAPTLEIAGRLRLVADERASLRRRQIEREGHFAELMAEARAAQTGGRLSAAYDSAQAALDLMPDDPQARDLARRSANELRLRSATAAPRTGAETVPSPVTETAALPIEETAPVVADAAPVRVPQSGRTTLRIDLFSHAPRGVLTVYAGDQQVLLRPFRFVRKSGFLRRKGTAGRLETEVKLPAGETTLRVMVSLPGREADVITLPAHLAGGGIELLRVSVSESGEARAELG